MTEIIILGLDIHVLEVIDIIEAAGEYNFAGIISQNADHPEDYFGHRILGGPEIIKKYAGVKKIPMHVWKDRAFKEDWARIIAPGSFLCSSAKIGRGCIIYPNCFVGANSRIGDGVFILSGSIINHDCDIGDDCVITSGVTLAGGVTVKKGAYLGQGCAVRQNLIIGEKSFVGMGAVVTKNVLDGETVIGCPARPYKK